MELEEVESKFGLPFIAITQPVQNTPTGRMVRRTLATMASFQTEQQSLDVCEGIARRVQEGWFPSNPPYGYQNVRPDKRSFVVTHLANSLKVKCIFDLRAIEQLLVEEIMDRLFEEGLFYSDSKPRFSRTKVNAILHDRSYLGFIWFRGQWWPGRHEPLVDQVTWDQVRVSFGEQTYRSHAMVYASQLIRCGFCGHAVTGEKKFKETKKGTKSYVYYRCSRYRTKGHPQVRITEKEFDSQLKEMLSTLEFSHDETCSWARAVATARIKTECADSMVRLDEVRRQLSLIAGQREELLNLRLSVNVTDEDFTRKKDELDDRAATLDRHLARHGQMHEEVEAMCQRAEGVFDVLSQGWLTMERRARQLVLTALFGGFTLEGRTLVPDNRTPLELFRAG